MDLGLRGKRALLLASSRGLGFGIAKALAGEGVEVMLCGRDETRLREAAAELSALGGGRVASHACDLSGKEAPRRVAEAAMDSLGGVDILLNNAGGPPMSTALETSDEQWLAYFESLVLAPIRVTREVVPGMKQRRWGRILTITSSGVPQPIPEMALSNTLRAAVTNWSKTLAGELAPFGITVNTLVPGRIVTDRVLALNEQAAKRQNRPPEEIHAEAVATVPAGREGTVEEFAAAALFLASDQGGYATGGSIRLDGGMIRSTMA